MTAAAALLAAAGAARAEDRAAAERPEPDPAHVAAAVRLMTDLGAESAGHALAIRDAYAPAVGTLALADRRSLRRALETGAILALPRDLPARNIRPRLTGRHPIGEADLSHQALYVGARPETVGLLLDIAARVRSGPLEVTSLARHRAYQRRLARTNANARTAVPTHAMGLAVDISILHATLAHAREVRDVLRTMARDGDLHFIAERRQLVFHVVPAPARRAHFAALSRGTGDAAPPPPSARIAATDPTPDPTQSAPAVDPVTPAVALTTNATAELPQDRAQLARLAGPARATPPVWDPLLAGVDTPVPGGLPPWWPMVLVAIGVGLSDLLLYWRTRGRDTDGATGRRDAGSSGD